MGKNAVTDLAIELLGKDYKQSDVATILQVSESAVSQIATTHKERIQEQRVDHTLTTRAIDEDIDALQATVLGALKEKVAFETDAMKLTKIFGILNNAKRRSSTNENPNRDANEMARLQLPTHLKQSVTFVQNTHNEITVVNDRSLATASQDRVKELMERRSKNNGLRTENAPLTTEDFEIKTSETE